MADSTRTTSRRRALLGAAITLPALGTAGAARAAAPNPDARLIALCTEVLANVAERDAIYDRYAHLPGAWTYTPEEDARIDELHDRRFALKAKIAAMRATTPAGRAAKAKLLMDNVGLDNHGEPLAEDALMASLCTDIIRAAQA